MEFDYGSSGTGSSSGSGIATTTADDRKFENQPALWDYVKKLEKIGEFAGHGVTGAIFVVKFTHTHTHTYRVALRSIPSYMELRSTPL